jgi:hypothetical protein
VLQTLTQIPDYDRAPENARPTGALKDLKVSGGRRTVLRAAALGAMTIGAAALDWGGALGTKSAKAETGPASMWGWDRNDCLDAYPSGYNEVADTNGYYYGTAACFGGTWRGSAYCYSGWHKNGTYFYGSIQGDSVPVYSSCSGRNAWRWTVNGIWYRCSDGNTTFYGGGYTGQTYFTICRY